MRGRKPTPRVLKLLRGNPGKRAINPDEPQPAAVGDVKPPRWLGKDAKKEWRRLAPLLARNGLLTELDVDALATYCEAWVRWRDANEKIRQFGMVIKAPNGMPMPSPYLPIANHAQAQLKALLAEFGMTPSSRSRVTVTKPLAAGDPVKERFFAQRA